MDSSSVVSPATAFLYFADLPIELQFQVWEECLAGPSMHIFDVRIPSSDDSGDRQRDGPRRKHGVFLDPVRSVDDPSMYKHRQALRQTSRLASLVSKPTWRATNTVYLPGRREATAYDNDADVLLLRLGAAPGGHAAPTGDDHPKDDLLARPGIVGMMLDAPWTAEFAETLRAARRVAFRAADVQGKTPWCVGDAFDAMRLACCIQQDLEVLYFVHEPSVCKCGCREWETKRPQDNVVGGRGRRELDVIQGMGRTYREVRVKRKNRDRFVRYLDAAVRQQQQDTGRVTFKEVRFLVAVDD